MKKSTEHPGFESGTFSLLVLCSTNWANESDGEEQWLQHLSVEFFTVVYVMCGRSLNLSRYNQSCLLEHPMLNVIPLSFTYIKEDVALKLGITSIYRIFLESNGITSNVGCFKYGWHDEKSLILLTHINWEMPSQVFQVPFQGLVYNTWDSALTKCSML